MYCNVMYFICSPPPRSKAIRAGRGGRLNKKRTIPEEKGNYKEVLVFFAPDQDLLK